MGNKDNTKFHKKNQYESEFLTEYVLKFLGTTV